MVTRKVQQVLEDAKQRRNRILTLITQVPPVDLVTIGEMEGMHDSAVRKTVVELCKEHNLNYMKCGSRRDRRMMPFGITQGSARFRSKLADALYRLRKEQTLTVVDMATTVGLNAQRLRAAESRPYNHDWKLSEIERLATALGRETREFLLECLTT
jgi:DNA-binding XRE family transcriptional regulator